MPKYKSKFRKEDEEPKMEEEPPLEIIPRSVYTSEFAKSEKGTLKIPCLDVVVTHTESAPCTDKESCIQRLKQIYKHHRGQGLDDIAHKFQKYHPCCNEASSAVKEPQFDLYPLRMPYRSLGEPSGTYVHIVNSLLTRMLLEDLQNINIQDTDDTSFLIGEDGNIYEGRGWRLKPYPLRRIKYKQSSDEYLQVAFIGTFGDGNGDERRPTMKLCYGLQYLMEFGMDKGYLERGVIPPPESRLPLPSAKTAVDVSQFD